jgi:hypothetical protein
LLARTMLTQNKQRNNSLLTSKKRAGIFTGELRMGIK